MIPRFAVVRRALCVNLLALLAALSASGANPAPSQLYYVPFPEADQLTGYAGLNSSAVDPLNVFVTFSAASDNTVIYYDHWEDGYEADISNPKQSTTQVFGDGNPANGYPPGNASDLIPAGTVFSLRNYVASTTGNSLIKFDARDKIASFKPISVTKTSYPASTNSLLAGSTEVLERGLWGTDYRVPVGVDMPTTTATTKLTWDADSFNYTSLSVMAGSGGATIQIDADNNGVYEQTVTLAEGGTHYIATANVGGRVISDKPVQVVMFAGRISSNYQSRTGSLMPVSRWSNSYYAPVSTSTTFATTVFLYNPGTSSITVSYDFRKSATAYTTATVTVPAGGNARVNLSPAADTTHFGAYRFYTTGASPANFYAFCAVDCGSTSTTNNQSYDGGFTLVGQSSLTTQILVGLGIGRDPTSSTNPNENGNPIWITTVGNGNTQVPVYVDYKGDNAGPFTDPNGNRYDLLLTLRELEQAKIFDPSGDQSGMLVYVLAANTKLTGAWAQDPTVGSAGQPGLDVATLVPPLREGDGSKGSIVAIDTDGDGFRSAGDTLEYDIRTVNTARTDIVGPFTVKDNLPTTVTYVPGSARFRYSVAGAWQAWTTIPDDTVGTAFPLDGGGFGVPGTLKIRQEIQVTFRAAIKDYANLPSGTQSVTNTGSILVTPFGITIDLSLTDPLFGSIGDRVWADTNGNAAQDVGEAGLNNVTVYLDLNGNGNRDSGEPSQVTAGNGNYAFNGLLAGTYQVRVDATSLSAINPGYGPTFDLDGIATSYGTSVVLASAQDRVDADFGFRIGASVGDRVWMDRDGNGAQSAGEPGIGGVRVYVDSNGNGAFDATERNSITSSDGTYFIGNLNPGAVTVRVDTSTLPGGASQTFDLDGIATSHAATVTLTSALHRGDVDFGYRGNQSIGDLVWDDKDGDATRTSYNIRNGRIDLDGNGSADNSDDGFIGSVQVIDGYLDLNGNGSITSADSGTYQGFTVISGDLDTNGSNTISNTDDLANAIFSEFGLANVRVFLDLNGNGLFEASEPSALTNANGGYTISNLFNGSYTVRVDTTSLPLSYVETYDLTAPTDDNAATVVLSGTSRTDVDFGYRRDASIGDRVWNDRNANGVVDAGEPGIEGVFIFIDTNNNGIFERATERFAVTDLDGYYVINNLPEGSFLVRVELSTLPQGATQTFDFDGTATANQATRTLALSEIATNVDFGYRSTAGFGDLVWNDSNANGVKDGSEVGISGVRVFADINGNGIFDSASEPSAVTATNGSYSIGNLVPGTFTARVDTSTLPAGMVPTFDSSGPVDNAATFSLTSAQVRTEIDFGYTSRVVIGDFVWNDSNANGRQDSGEVGLPDVTVTVFNAANDTIAGTTVTNASGIYSFPLLLPGTYYVIFDKPVGFNATFADLGNDTGDSDANSSTGRTANVTLTGGQSNLTLDAGFYQTVTVGDFVFNDANGNGIQDTGETGLAGVLVSIYRPGFGPDGIAGTSDDAAVVASQTTAAGGAYSFPGLRPGTYQVGFGALTGYNRTPADQGSDDAKDSDASVTTGLTGSYLIAAGSTNNQIDAGYYQPGSISGFVLADTNNDDSGDSPLSGVTLTLVNASGSPIDGDPNTSGVQPITAITAANGSYSFAGLAPGTYGVLETQPSGYISVSDKDGGNLDEIRPITVTAGASNSGNNFVEEQLGSISGSVMADTDNNDSGDSPLAGVTVTLKKSNGDTVATTVTGANGGYTFPGLPPGSYQVVESDPSGYNSVTTNTVSPVVVNAGAATTGVDFVDELTLGTVAGHLYIDSNDNGTQDGGEPNLANVDVVITDSNDVSQTVSTNSGGNWVATVPPGTTTIVVNTSDADFPIGFTQREGDDPTTVTAVAGTEVDGGIDGYSQNLDSDKDGIPDSLEISSACSGGDTDGDGVPDYLDLDSDGDGIFDLVEAGNGALDADKDGMVDSSTGTNGLADSLETSPDSGVINYTLLNSDLDGRPDYLDLDSDNDSISDVLEYGNGSLVDTQNDGIADGVVNSQGIVSGAGATTPVDADGDLVPDYRDVESNGDGVFDIADNGYSALDINLDGMIDDTSSPNDCDGIPDVLDPQDDVYGWFPEMGCTVWSLNHADDTDGDVFPIDQEYAFGGDPELGDHRVVGTTRRQGMTIAKNGTVGVPDGAPGGVDISYVRPKGRYDATVTLYVSADPRVAQSWTAVSAVPVITDNGDTTETVKWSNVHDISGNAAVTRDRGFARLKVETPCHPDGSWTLVQGWCRQDVVGKYQTYGVNFSSMPVFTGYVDAAAGSVIATTTSGKGQNLGAYIGGGATCFIEFTDGPQEGHRFDISSGEVDVFNINLASKNNTAAALPMDLAGSHFVVRRHDTLGGIYANGEWNKASSPGSADQVQLYNGTGYDIYFNRSTNVWVLQGSGNFNSRNGLIIAPGVGMMVAHANPADTNELLAIGDLRYNNFRRPLLKGVNGLNFLAMGFPFDASPASLGMNASNGFVRSSSPGSATQIQNWLGDSTPNITGWTINFLRTSTAWYTQGNLSQITTESLLFKHCRSNFVLVQQNKLDWNHVLPWLPAPWIQPER